MLRQPCTVAGQVDRFAVIFSQVTARLVPELGNRGLRTERVSARRTFAEVLFQDRLIRVAQSTFEKIRDAA
jgi:hypothetical protein